MATSLSVKFRLPVKGSLIAIRVMNSYGVPRTEKGLIVKKKEHQTPVRFSHWCYGKVISDPEYAEDCVILDLHLRDVIDYKGHVVYRKHQKLTFDTYGKMCSIDKSRVDVWYVMDRPAYECVMGQDNLLVQNIETEVVTLTNKECPIATFHVMTSKTVDEELACVYCNKSDANHKKQGIMYICSQCDKGYHKGCLECDKKPLPLSDEADEDWLCWQCCTPKHKQQSPKPNTFSSTPPAPPKERKEREQKRQKTQQQDKHVSNAKDKAAPVPAPAESEHKEEDTCHGCEKTFKFNSDTCRVVSVDEKYCAMCTKYGC
jgi:hypothetical protein